MTSYTKGFDSIVAIFGHSYIPYRFGFNGKENDDEINGWQDYGERMYNRLIGRFPTPDPLIVKGKQYPELSPYQFASNSPIWAIDLDGLEAWPLSVTNTGSQTGYQRHINSIFNKFLKVTTSINIITDCGKFQYFLMSKYFEKTGQKLSFTGQDNKVYDSHAQDSEGNYIYNSFTTFFLASKRGISTGFLRKGGNGLTRKMESNEPLSTGNMFINKVHAEALVLDGDKSYMFYGSGQDIYSGNCLSCKTDVREINTTNGLENSEDRYEWSFVGQLPQNAEINKMPSIKAKEIPIEKQTVSLE